MRCLALEVPLFPLRKMPRLPTEELCLNLFEPRYLSLAREVLESDAGVFAAVYCEGASVLPHGQGPPTPLIKNGAIGVLCEVRQSIVKKDKIRLETRAFSRCRLTEIVASPIFDSPSQPPYIIANVDAVIDENSQGIATAAQAADAERRATEALRSVDKLVDRIWPDMSDFDDESAEDHDDLNRFSPDSQLAELERQYCFVDGCEAFLPSRQELYSFTLLSTLDLSESQRTEALSETNTLERLEYIVDELEHGRNWLAARAALADIFDGGKYNR